MGERAITTRMVRIWLDDDIIHAELLHVESTRADVDVALAALAELVGQRPRPLLADIRRVRGVDRGGRTHAAGPEGARYALALALLVGSPLSRALGNFFLGLNKPLVPCRLFTSEPEALAWLRGFLGTPQDPGTAS